METQVKIKSNPPPIEPGRPGDLMLVLRHGLSALEKLRDMNAPPEEAMPIAATIKTALDYWLGLGMPPGTEPETPN